MEEETKHFDQDDEKVEQSVFELLLHGARRVFRENLPLDIIKQLEGRYIVVLGCIGYGITFSMFIAFFVMGYLQRENEIYISTDPSVGECVEVGKALTGTFLASSAGVWEGSQGFKYHEAMYSFRFTDLVVTSNEFRTLITKDFDLLPLKSFMSTHDLPSNLIAYTNFVDSVVVKGKAQTMSLAATPSDVFNRNYRNGYVYDVNASYCYTDGILFDGSSTSYAFLFGKKPNNENCIHLTDYIVNYDSKIINNFGIFRFDLNTFAAAMAVNLKLLSLDQFEVVEDKGIFDMNGLIIKATRVHNPRFPKMNPIACAVAMNAPNASWSPFCMAVQNDKAFLPVLYHFRKACRGCSNAKATVQAHIDELDARKIFSRRDGSEIGRTRNYANLASTTQDDPSCNVIDLVAAMVFVPIEPLDASYAELLKLVLSYSTTELNSLVADSAGTQSNATKELFQVCPLCTVISANLYDTSMIIGQHGQTLQGGHCTMSLDTTNFYKLGETPPQQLVENYFECTDTTFGAFFYAIGVAFGNTGTFAPIILMTLVPIIFILLGCLGSKVPFEHYSEDVTDDATKELVRLLLKIKDGKMDNIYPDGVLANFVAEVKDAHKNIERRRRSISGKHTPRKKFLLSSPPSVYDITKPPTPVESAKENGTGGRGHESKRSKKSIKEQFKHSSRKQVISRTATTVRAELMKREENDGSELDFDGEEIEDFDYGVRFGGLFGQSSDHMPTRNSGIADLDLQPTGRISAANLPVPRNGSRDEGEEGEAVCPDTPLVIRAEEPSSSDDF